MVQIVKKVSKLTTFFLLGIFFIVFAFLGTSNFDYIDNAKIVLFIVIGIFSLLVGAIDFVINKYNDLIDLNNYIYLIFVFAGIVEGTYILFENVFILAFIIYLIPLIIFGFNALYKYYKTKNKVTLLDDYLINGLTLTGFSLEIIYLIFSVLPSNFSDGEFTLSIIALVLLITSSMAYLSYFIVSLIKNIRFDFKTLKYSGAIFTLIFLGAFHIALNYELLFGDGATFSPSIGYISCFIIGVLALILGVVLYFMTRKNYGKKENKQNYIAFLFITIIQTLQFIVCLFFYGPQQIDMFIPWAIVVLIPLITLFVKSTFSKSYDVSVWFEIASSISIIIYVAFGTIWSVINYASQDYLPIYLTIFVILLLLSSISVLTFLVPNLIENFKGSSD